MGDPRLPRRKYSRPSHPWQKQRIIKEAELRKNYAYKNKKELWKTVSKLRRWRAQARSLIALSGTKQGELEKKQLINKLSGYGLIPKNGNIEDVLNLKVEDLMERRLQTLVYKKGLANTIKQARQFITHGHVKINDVKVTSPSYLVKLSEEQSITINPTLKKIIKNSLTIEKNEEVANNERTEETIKEQI